jgi:spore coat protein A
MNERQRTPSRRHFLGAVAGSAGLITGVIQLGPNARAADSSFLFRPPTAHDQPTVPALDVFAFRSPVLEPFVDPLPVLPIRRIGGEIVVAESRHKFHRDLDPAPSWGYAGQTHLGPVLEAMSGEDVVTTFVNDLGRHIIAEYIDTSLHGVSPEDSERPPTVVHLHGAPNAPVHDGFPLATFRPGERAEYRFNNDLAATTLWYHDHTMGNTRLNVYAGLAAPYYVRDRWDTGRPGNPLGLPTGDREIPLLMADKVIYPGGGPRYNAFITELFERQWGGGLIGDVMVVNGKIWPYLEVDRALYRFRVINGSQLNGFRLSLSNGMPFWVIGSDGGLLDAPVPVAAFDIAPGERYDVLVDFSRLAPGDHVELRNSMQVSWTGQLAGGHFVPQVMRFVVGQGRGDGGTVPARLRGIPGRTPPALPALPRPTAPAVTHTLGIAVNPHGRSIAILFMNIDNLAFDSGDIDVAEPGTVQRWSLVNADLTTQLHAVHLHLVQFRVLGRQNYDPVRYFSDHPVPPLGTRWAPPVEPYLSGPPEPPAPYETGWKDTVACPPGQVTHILVRWPTAAELGFDPDAPFRRPDGGTERGYIWHCHMLDHEDNEMMRRLRIVPATDHAPRSTGSRRPDPAITSRQDRHEGHG